MEFSVAYAPTNDGFRFYDKVSKQDVNSTVHEYYVKHHAASGSAQEWLHRIQNNQISFTATGKPAAADSVLKAGDRLTYFRLPWAEPEAPSSITLLYEDEHVLAIAKPAGLQVLPKASFCQRTVLGLLQAYQQQVRRTRYPGSQQAVPVHRLGRGTSGVLLCSCTVAARRKLCRDFSASTELGVLSSRHRNARVESESLFQQGTASGSSGGGKMISDCTAAPQRPLGKTYRALVAGIVEQDKGEVDVAIGPVSYPGLSSGLFAASPSGKPARSLFRVLHRHAASSLVEVTILTGRPHQIRIHMAALGHPLVGDPLYGPGGMPLDAVVSASGLGAYGDAANAMPGDCGYHLHSMDLRFHHPATGAEMRLTAPVPAALQTPHQAAACSAAELLQSSA
ncbi:RNA pseudourine synthase 5-like protein [Scenedesmus sp. NREL 46B-D3]|nr:RNA pseudourine synthase 5-like protein [Scenedesmus sp. NREL 46B-D3]